MFTLLRNWLRHRLGQPQIPAAAWQSAMAALPLIARLHPPDRERLRSLATLFLQQKALEPAGGLELAPEMGPRIAVQACLPILNLGLDYYRDWSSIILYPEGFLARHEYTDSNGLVHNIHRPLIGEAWERGPVILSWANVAASTTESGHNVVIHEMAHKLDMLTGRVNGLPPLHRDMAVQDWSQIFNDAYQHLCQEVDWGRPTAVDPYAADSPGEFFAVISEAFFTTPERVIEAYPNVYQQLRAFYRQDPLAQPHS